MNKIFEVPVVEDDGDRLAEGVLDDEGCGLNLPLVLSRLVSDLGERLRQRVEHPQE